MNIMQSSEAIDSLIMLNPEYSIPLTPKKDNTQNVCILRIHRLLFYSYLKTTYERK